MASTSQHHARRRRLHQRLKEDPVPSASIVCGLFRLDGRDADPSVEQVQRGAESLSESMAIPVFPGSVGVPWVPVPSGGDPAGGPPVPAPRRRSSPTVPRLWRT